MNDDSKPEDSGEDTSADSDSGETADTVVDETGDTDTATTAPEQAILDLTLTPSSVISTVANITWRTEHPATAWVEFGETSAYDHVTGVAVDLTTEHAIVLAGVPADVTWHWRAASMDGDGKVVYSEDQEFTTGPLPDWVPEPVVGFTTGLEVQEGYFVSSLLTGDSDNIVFVFDPEGRPVWWWASESTVSLSRARLSLDGVSILYDACVGVKDSLEAECFVHRVRLDGELDESTPTPEIHHDFIETDGGGFLYLKKVTLPYTVDGVEDRVSGDALVAGDPMGTATTLWSSWTAMSVDISAPDSWNGSTWDWTHCNSIQSIVDPAGWVLSCKLIDAVLFIATDGTILAQVGGSNSTVTLTSGTPTYHQHHATWDGDAHGGTLTVFDNQTLLEDARAVRFAVDFDAGTYAETWSYAPAMDVYADGRGSVISVGDTTVIAWGSASFATQVDPAGQLLWQADFGEGHTLGYTEWAHQIGGPAAVVEVDTGV